MYMKQLGKNIKHLRQQQGWNQEQVAEKLGISIPSYSKMETGITDINISRLNQLATIFKVGLLKILTDPLATSIHIFEDELRACEAKLIASEKEIMMLQRKIIALLEELRKLEPSMKS
jgi:transcriptional regulator with XRE-family HTH domain